MKVTRITTLYCIALVIVTLGLLAFAPLQTGEPPAPAIDPISAILTGVITLLTGAAGWLLIEVRKLKAQATAQVRLFTPDAWKWILDDLAPILVRATCQALPQGESENILLNMQLILWSELKQRRIVVSPAQQASTAAIFQGMVSDFYTELRASKQPF